MTDASSTRRSLLRRCGAAVGVAGSVSLAGCPSPGETVFDQLGDDGGDGDGSESERPPPPITREPDYEDWFEDVDGYEDGTVVYRADRESVTVTVGADRFGEANAFHWPAIAVAIGTTVAWEWTASDARHNVVAEDGSFDSGSPVASRSDPFRHEFTEPGTYRYVCERHEDEGMKGAVFVYDPDEE